MEDEIWSQSGGMTILCAIHVKQISLSSSFCVPMISCEAALDRSRDIQYKIVSNVGWIKGLILVSNPSSSLLSLHGVWSGSQPAAAT